MCLLVTKSLTSERPLECLSLTVPSPNIPRLAYFQKVVQNVGFTCTLVSRIYAPRFATLTLVESVGGAYNYAGSDILSREYATSSVPRLDVDITLYYRPIEAADLPSQLVQKLDDQDRLTEVGHSVDSGVFQAFRGFVLSMCCC